MKDNYIALESPFKQDSLQPSNIIKTENLQPQSQDMVWMKPVFFQPVSITPIFSDPYHQNQPSNQAQYENSRPFIKQENIFIERHSFQHNHRMQTINQWLVFSENQDEFERSPIKIQQSYGKYTKKCQIDTIKKKSSFLQSYFEKIRSLTKGLKAISRRCYQIVYQMRKTTYKQVAQKIIIQLRQDQKGEKKQEMNIKRRVYDALNVLIALRLINKDEHNCIIISPAFVDSEQKSKIESKIKTKLSSIQEKRRKLNEIKESFELITILMQRNRTQNIGKELTISFPFVGMCIDKVEFEKSKKQNKNEVYIKSMDKIQPFGDFDAIKHLKYWLQRLDINEQMSVQDQFNIKIEKEQAY